MADGTRFMARYWDPTGSRYGFPTYPWGWGPDGLLTRRQLQARKLRPGGHDPVAQIRWPRRDGRGVAFLYDASVALPKRTATPAQLEALAKAQSAKRRCPQCERDVGYILPRHLGTCLDCAPSR